MAQARTLSEVRASRVTNGNGRLILPKQRLRPVALPRPTPRAMPVDFVPPILVLDPVKRIFPILRFDPTQKTPGFVPPTKRPADVMRVLPFPMLPDRSRVGCPGCGPAAEKPRIAARLPIAERPQMRTMDFQDSGFKDASGRPIDSRDLDPASVRTQAQLVAAADSDKFNLLSLWPVGILVALVVLAAQDETQSPGPVFCTACKAIKSRRGPCKRCAKRKGA